MADDNSAEVILAIQRASESADANLNVKIKDMRTALNTEDSVLHTRISQNKQDIEIERDERTTADAKHTARADAMEQLLHHTHENLPYLPKRHALAC